MQGRKEIEGYTHNPWWEGSIPWWYVCIACPACMVVGASRAIPTTTSGARYYIHCQRYHTLLLTAKESPAVKEIYPVQVKM